MSLLKNEKYDPDNLLDSLIGRFQLKNDARLSRFLGLEAPVISKLRHRRVPVGPGTLLRIHDKTGIAVNELRQLMGVEPVRAAA